MLQQQKAEHARMDAIMLQQQRWSMQGGDWKAERVIILHAGAAAMFASFKRLDFWDLLQNPPPGVDIHIVRAANSDRFSQRELDALKGIQRGDASGNGRVHVHVLPDAGHWLHVENPEGLLKMISHPLAAAAGPQQS